MFPVLDDYDWAEVFGEGDGGNCHPINPNRAPTDDKTSNATFSREDVEVIFGMSAGERDERDWIVYGQLKDGRFFIARGGCDYTGWDCQAGNSGDVASSLGDLIQFGMSSEERDRLLVSRLSAIKSTKENK